MAEEEGEQDRYQWEERLGHGSFGVVYHAVKISSGEQRAIKLLGGCFRSWEEVVALREVQALIRTSAHPNIVTLYEMFRCRQQYIYLVFEYMSDGTLSDYIWKRVKNREGPLTSWQIRSLLHQVCQGLNHLHLNQYIHRDLKPENVLLCDNGRTAKLADFSLARGFHESAEPLTTYVSTRWYRAPEVLLGSSRYSCPVDVFALGCVAADLFRFRPLFPGKDGCDQLKRIFELMGTPADVDWKQGQELLSRFPMATAWNIRTSFGQDGSDSHDMIVRHRLGEKLKLSSSSSSDQQPDGSSTNNEQDDWAVDLVYGCLRLEPSKRLTMPHVLKHAFFAGEAAAVAALDDASDKPNTTQIAFAGSSGATQQLIPPAHGSSTHHGSHGDGNGHFSPSKSSSTPESDCEAMADAKEQVQQTSDTPQTNSSSVGALNSHETQESDLPQASLNTTSVQDSKPHGKISTPLNRVENLEKRKLEEATAARQKASFTTSAPDSSCSNSSSGQLTAASSASSSSSSTSSSSSSSSSSSTSATSSSTSATPDQASNSSSVHQKRREKSRLVTVSSHKSSPLPPSVLSDTTGRLVNNQQSPKASYSPSSSSSPSTTTSTPLRRMKKKFEHSKMVDSEDDEASVNQPTIRLTKRPRSNRRNHVNTSAKNGTNNNNCKNDLAKRKENSKTPLPAVAIIKNPYLSQRKKVHCERKENETVE